MNIRHFACDSSLLSPQSSTPSHTHDWGIHWPARWHLNFFPQHSSSELSLQSLRPSHIWLEEMHLPSLQLIWPAGQAVKNQNMLFLHERMFHCFRISFCFKMFPIFRMFHCFGILFCFKMFHDFRMLHCLRTFKFFKCTSYLLLLQVANDSSVSSVQSGTSSHFFSKGIHWNNVWHWNLLDGQRIWIVGVAG